MDTERVELKIDTLSGDIRDALLTHVREMPEVWAKLSERAQQDKIDSIESMAGDLVRRAVGMVAASGFNTLHVKILDFGVKGGIIRGKFESRALSINVLALADHENAGAVLVLSDPSDYMGESAPALADPDAPELPGVEPEEGGDNDTDDLSLPPDLDRRKGKGTQPDATA